MGFGRGALLWLLGVPLPIDHFASFILASLIGRFTLRTFLSP